MKEDIRITIARDKFKVWPVGKKYIYFEGLKITRQQFEK